MTDGNSDPTPRDPMRKTMLIVCGTNEQGKAIAKEVNCTCDYVLFVKLGNEDRPATDEDFKYIAQQIELAVTAKDRATIITHHLISFEYVKIP